MSTQGCDAVLVAQVTKEVNMYRQLGLDLLDAIEKLEGRLGDVMVPAVPAPESVEETKGELVPLASELYDNNCNLHNNIRRLTNLRVRIEI